MNPKDPDCVTNPDINVSAFSVIGQGDVGTLPADLPTHYASYICAHKTSLASAGFALAENVVETTPHDVARDGRVRLW